MAITSGFFNSLNGDRVYDADDFGALFDGVVTEGIFTTIYPGKFECTYLGLHPTTGRDRIGIAAGKAWFNHTWITSTEQDNHQMPSRITGYWIKVAMCIVVDKRQSTRANTLQQITLGSAYGSLANAQNDPIPSTFYNPETDLWRYPLAFVYVPPSGDSSVPTIMDNRGTATCPYSRAGEEVIDVAHGGTGATTPSQALANLGASPVGHNHDDRYFTETEINTLLSTKANASNVYTKSEIDTALASKSNTGHNHDERYYLKTDADTLLAAKANASNVYTKAQVDEIVSDIESGTVDTSQLPVIPLNKGGTGVAAASKQAVREGLEITPANIGAAAASHTHAASAIASGTLPVARGGTGGTTAAEARTQLGAAASSHTHGASDIASGTLSSDRLPTVPISKGGTGATTAAAALTALGAAAASHNHAASAITSGTLSSDRLPTVPAGKGGSGQTSLQASLDAFIGSGRIKLTSGTHYGTSLPSSGNVAGRLFFLKV